MLDIDFLQRPSLEDRNIVYIYRSGILKKAVKRAIAEQRDWKIAETIPQDLMGHDPAGSLFKPEPLMIFCDWGQAPGLLEHRAYRNLLLKPPREVPELHVHLVPVNCKGLDHALSALLKKHCQVILEPAVEPNTIVPIIDYFDQSTGLLGQQRLAGDRLFIKRFLDLLDNKRADLADVMSAYKEQVLACTDLETGKFDPSVHEELWRIEASTSSPRARLLTMLKAATPGTTDDFITAFVVRGAERKWQGENYYSELSRLTVRVVGISTEYRSSAQAGTGHQLADSLLLLWCGLLMAWKPIFVEASEGGASVKRGPDTVAAAVATLCHEYRRRKERAKPVDAELELAWLSMERKSSGSIANPVIDQAERRLSEALLNSSLLLTRPIWASLQRYCQQIVLEQEIVTSEIALGPPQVLGAAGLTSEIPPRLNDLILQADTSSNMWRFLAQHDTAPSLILHGPPEAEKNGLARIYALSLYCGRSRGKGPACGECDACRGGFFQFGYQELDGRSKTFLENISEAVKASEASGLAKKTFVVKYIDQARRQDLDPLLKVLEEGSSKFIFTADHIDMIGHTVRSRCTEIPVRSLTGMEARALVIKLLEANASDETRLVDLLVAVSSGNIQTMLQIAMQMRKLRLLAFNDVFKHIGLDWPDRLGRVWPVVLARGSVVDAIPLCSASDSAQAVQRVQALLTFIQANIFSGHDIPGSAEFSFMKSDIKHAIMQKFADYAELRSQSAVDLCVELSERWL